MCDGSYSTVQNKLEKECFSHKKGTPLHTLEFPLNGWKETSIPFNSHRRTWSIYQIARMWTLNLSPLFDSTMTQRSKSTVQYKVLYICTELGAHIHDYEDENSEFSFRRADNTATKRSKCTCWTGHGSYSTVGSVHLYGTGSTHRLARMWTLNPLPPVW